MATFSHKMGYGTPCVKEHVPGKAPTEVLDCKVGSVRRARDAQRVRSVRNVPRRRLTLASDLLAARPTCDPFGSNQRRQVWDDSLNLIRAM